jgi:hypothetical protein
MTMKAKDTMQITVYVRGGNVQDVEGVPEGVEVIVVDYDNAVDNDGKPTEAEYTSED